MANSVFVGTTIKYQVRLASGTLLRVDAPAGTSAAVPIGDEVTLLWSPHDARVYRNGVLES